MEQYVVSARKYRPATFASVVGQKALTSTLRNAVASGRLASSYLFCGSRGVGKTTCARIFAKAINCEHLTAAGEPCNECESCLAFNNNTSLNIIEMDAASNNSVDDIRAIVSQVQVPPSSGRYRVFIVDEVHMLSSAAFNAFLKTLEEPPSYVVFILATTEKHKIIPTILSRCQIYDFHRITVNDMIDHMLYVAGNEGIEAEPSALNVIAQKADGAMRDALSIFDQIAASTQGHITYESALDNLNMLDSRYYSRLLDAFLEERVLDTWMIYKEIRDKGFDSLFFINGLGDYFRNLMAATTPQTLSLVEANPEVQQAMAADASKCTPQFLLRAMSLCNDADMNYRTSSGKQFLIELTLAKICQLSSPSPADGGQGEGHLKPVAAATATRPAQPVQAAGVTPVQPSARPSAQPQAQPAQTPAPVQPRPLESVSQQPMPLRTRRAATTLRQPGISISGAVRQHQQPAPTAAVTPTAAPTTGRTEPFTQEALEAAWDAYIAAHPKEHVLINTMKSGRPVATSAGHYDVMVLNAYQQGELHASLADITAHLRNSLKNDTITIDVKINEGAPPRHTLSDKELLVTMVEAHPVIQKFIDEFKLKLS